MGLVRVAAAVTRLPPLLKDLLRLGTSGDGAEASKGMGIQENIAVKR